MKNYYLRHVLVLFAAVTMLSCENQIFPELKKAEPLFVVDAFITNKPGQQRIRIARSQPYFESVLPPGVRGAIVAIEDSEGNVYNFIEAPQAGTYIWSPASTETFGEVGLDYRLRVTTGNEVFEATSSMNPVPAVDSITFFSDEGPDLISAEFWAFDPEGAGDYYWVKAFKNDTLLNKPSEINLSIDGAFDEDNDPIQFILPIRQAVNPIPQSGNLTAVSPYKVGDFLYVEINSINKEVHNFFTIVKTQTDRQGGFGELFSVPLANVPTNLRNTRGTSKVAGFFSVSATSGLGRRLKSLADVKKK